SGLSLPEQIDQLRRFAEEIAPVVRREAPTTLWQTPEPLSPAEPTRH
ncbi:LLM class flavin-dependent oxidoreductase, partial [Streptomyces sp. NPDC059710]